MSSAFKPKAPAHTTPPSQTLNRLGNLEQAVTFLVAGYKELKTQKDASANGIGRLELHCFAVIKLLIERGVFSFEELQAAMQELLQAKDLNAYFGLSQEAEPETVPATDPTEEELAEEAATAEDAQAA